MRDIRVNSMRKKRDLGLLHPLLSLFIPMIVFLFAYAAVRIYPFGDKQILTVDLFHQYAPFLQELRTKILAGDSLFFSWTGGLGINFYPLFAYYLSSPFNLILLFFPAAYLAEGILLISLIKIGLSAFSCYVFLRRGKEVAKTTALIFSLPYALSAYIVAYSWNIMWLDVVLLLPLLAYATILIVRENRIVPYIVVLSLSILANYYLAFFACIFISIYFVLQMIDLMPENPSHRLRDYLSKIGLFTASSLLSGFISFFLIWPCYLALKLTSAAGDNFPKPWNFKQSILDLFPRLFFAAKPDIRSGLPNIYLGVFVLLLLPLFFLSKRVPKRRKFANAAAILILCLSFNVNVLDFIWHGFHYPNQIPYRYAFVFVFLILALSAEAWENFSWTREGAATKTFLSIGLLTILLRRLSDIDFAFWPLIITFALLLAYLSLLLLKWRKPRREELISALMFLLICCELGISTFLGINKISKNEYYGSRDGYSYGETPREIRAAAKELREKHPNSLVRTEIRPKKSVNDPMLYGLNGFSIFTSSFSHDPIRMIGKLGYPVNGVNSFEYTDSTIAMNDLFGINYIINRDPDLDLRSSAVASFEGEKIRVHENKGAFPFALSCPKSVLEYTADADSPFINQSNLFKALFSTDEIFEAVKFTLPKPEEENQDTGSDDAEDEDLAAGTELESNSEYDISDYDQGGQILHFTENLIANEAEVELEADEAGNYYLYYKSSSVPVKNAYLAGVNALNGEYKHLSYRRNDLIDLGYLQSGDKIRLKFNFEDDCGEGSIMLYPVRFIADNYKGIREQVAADDFQWKKFSSAELEFMLSAKEDGYAFLSTTYDAGWRVEVDGEEVKPLALDQCFLMIPVKAGRQLVRMKFRPLGFSQAALLSLAALFLFIVIAVLEYLSLRRKRQEEYAYTEDYYLEEEDEYLPEEHEYLTEEEEADTVSEHSAEIRELSPVLASPKLKQRRLKEHVLLQEAIAAAEGKSKNIEEFLGDERIQALTIKRRQNNGQEER